MSSSAVGLTVPSGGADFAVIRCSTANVRWRDDSGAAAGLSTSNGVPMKADEVLEYDGALGSIQFIRSGAADATLDISYYA